MMPICHDRRLIFIHVPKTGGTSVLSALREAGLHFEYDATDLWDAIIGRSDTAELVADYRRVFKIGTLSRAQQQHLPATMLRRLVEPELWESYTKIAFVRNPWDLLVSSFYYQVHARTDAQRALNPDMSAILDRVTCFEDFVGFFPTIRSDMSSFFCDENGRQIVDVVGRFEDIEQDFERVCRLIGVAASLPHKNRSTHQHYRSYYSERGAAAVARHFARDIERFGYVF